MKRCCKFFLMLALCLSLFSCSSYLVQGKNFYTGSADGERELTLVVYMACDNNLEAAALEDLNEMEAADFDAQKLTVLTLVDRSPAYTAQDGDWSGTRLYKIEHDKNGMNSALCSTELECSELSLYPGKERELNMSDGSVLSGLLLFAQREYAAKNYALVIWGHGTGWRGVGENSPLVKAFAFDDSSAGYMSLCSLRSAIEDGMNGKPLMLLGFDTCFGLTLEVCLELKSCARFLCAGEGVASLSGWNYRDWLSKAVFPCGAEELCMPLVSYFLQNGDRSFGVVNLKKTEEVFLAFEEFSKDVAELALSGYADEIKNIIWDTGLLRAKGVESDAYMNVCEFAKKACTAYPPLSAKKAALENALKATVVLSSDAERKYIPLGVYVCDVSAQGDFVGVSSAYKKNPASESQCEFIQRSDFYVPCGKASSLLDVLFG